MESSSTAIMDAVTIHYSSPADSYGWLNILFDCNSVVYNDQEYSSTEALFQCLRFSEDKKVQEAIRGAESSIEARRVASFHSKKLKKRLCDAADVKLMRFCLLTKLKSNPQFIAPLLETGTAIIIEEVSGSGEEVEIDGHSYGGGKPFWGAVRNADTWIGENTMGKLWIAIRDDLMANGKTEFLSPRGDKVSVSASPVLGGAGFSLQPLTKSGPLSPEEEEQLKECETRISNGQKTIEKGFVAMVEAMHEVYEKRLYRADGRTFEEYFQQKWRYQRAHSYRLRHCGRLIRVMNQGIVHDLTSQAHFRPLIDLKDDNLIADASNRLRHWKHKDGALVISPAVVTAAAQIVTPRSSFTVSDSRDPRLSTDEVLGLIDRAKGDIEKKPGAAKLILGNLKTNIESLARKRTTGISWTDDTWNPLQGCKKISAGCRHCYAAKLLATRLQGKFPGIAKKLTEAPKDSSPYVFTGKIQLLVRMLGEPLLEKRPRRYFVNSLSDLFYDEVPEWFIDEVFDVMEKADWHQFQVLTKRPEIMARYTIKRYADSAPPKNVWLGCSIEDKLQHKTRMPHMKKVVAAIRWISAEPLLESVDFDLSAIDWVVVGGESSGGHQMKRDWAISIRDQCKKAGVAFYFKQWGDFGEDGLPAKKKKGKGHPTLDGKIYDAYPA